jgi:putative ABC transport system permease protein
MIKNYTKIAWRNLLKNKFYASVNIVGLTLGLTVGLLILLWVNDELSYDRFNTNAGQLYRVNVQMGNGSSEQVWTDVQGPVAVYAMNEIPEVQNAVRIVHNYKYSIFKHGDKLFNPNDGVLFVDPSFFKVFDFKLLKGSVNTPFPNNQSVIITQATAKRFFGNDDPIGKIIQADNKDNYTVTGLMANTPQNSSIQFDMLFSINIRKQEYSSNDYWKSFDGDWGNFYVNTFLQVRPGTSLTSIENKLTKIHARNHSDAGSAKYLLQPLTQLHLYSADGNAADLKTVRVFLLVAVLILLIACINYVNLSTARAMLRSKEVSMRKIIGAARRQLFAQFVIETALFFLIALILSFIAIKLLMPLYNNVAGKQMEFNITDIAVWKIIGITVIATLGASSIYPALLLSSFKPVSALKGKISLGIGNVAFRKILVVSQFIFSIGLIIGTIVINGQLRYIREKKLGYDKEHVFSLDMRDMKKNYEGVRAQLLSQPGIYGITSAGGNVINLDNSTLDNEWNGKAPGRNFIIHPLGVDQYYFDFFKLKLVAGKSFSGSDTDPNHFILNETAIKAAGIKNPIGKRFKLWDVEGIIIGVVKDFHFASLKQKIEPAILQYKPRSNRQLFVKTSGKDAVQAISELQKVWKQYNAGFPMEYTFLDENYGRLYKSDQRSGTLFGIFAGIAILISCLGLFGLATYNAQVKVKEIGIRKVLGATVIDITSMLSRDILALVFIAFVITAPIAWYLMTKWLMSYAYHSPLQWWVVVIGGITAMLIALITISVQSIKAAFANPVKSLRSE